MDWTKIKYPVHLMDLTDLKSEIPEVGTVIAQYEKKKGWTKKKVEALIKFTILLCDPWARKELPDDTWTKYESVSSILGIDWKVIEDSMNDRTLYEIMVPVIYSLHPREYQMLLVSEQFLFRQQLLMLTAPRDELIEYTRGWDALNKALEFLKKMQGIEEELFGESKQLKEEGARQLKKEVASGMEKFAQGYQDL